MDKCALSERDICTKFITPKIVAAGWDVDTEIREEISFTKAPPPELNPKHSVAFCKREKY